jgi:hypothetical protein
MIVQSMALPSHCGLLYPHSHVTKGPDVQAPQSYRSTRLSRSSKGCRFHYKFELAGTFWNFPHTDRILKIVLSARYICLNQMYLYTLYLSCNTHHTNFAPRRGSTRAVEICVGNEEGKSRWKIVLQQLTHHFKYFNPLAQNPKLNIVAYRQVWRTEMRCSLHHYWCELE